MTKMSGTISCTFSFHILRILVAADLNLDFLSVKILCSMFARTDCQEKFLVLNLEIQSCDNVAAVR